MKIEVNLDVCHELGEAHLHWTAIGYSSEL